MRWREWQGDKMRILDLDLDFFLDGSTSGKHPDSPREPSSEFTPWPEARVRDFLENQCKLSVSRKTPGKFVTHHHEAFFAWNSMISNGHLPVPFEVVHVDAHADLGFAVLGSEYLFEDVLWRPIIQRTQLVVGSTDDEALNCGNYLLFAIGCGWLSNLTYVFLEPLVDYYPLLFRNNDPHQGVIALPKLQPGQFMASLPQGPNAVPREPDVQFTAIHHLNWSTKDPFDFMILCHSPPYTPVESDFLIQIIQEYMDLTVKL